MKLATFKFMLIRDRAIPEVESLEF
jgi:hypothetical protein